MGTMSEQGTRRHLKALPIAITFVITLTWGVRGPAVTLMQRTEQNGYQLDEKQFRVLTEAAAGPANWTLNYTEHLRTAYAPQQGRINPHDFQLILDEPLACMESKEGPPKTVFLLVLIATVGANFRKREAIRETWGSVKELDGLPIVTLFLLASGGRPNLDRRIVKESAEHHDLLMEDFRDTYRNLTLKTLMAMKWASTHCPQASFVMKTDDDMFVSFRNLIDYLAASKAPSAEFALGRVLAGKAPFRYPKSKYYVSRELFPGDVFPPWLSGGGFVLSGDLPGRVYAVSLDIKYLHLEDVYVGMCLEELKTALTANDQFNNMHIGYFYCKFRNVITSHRFSPAELRSVWNDMLIPKPCWFWT